MPEEPVTGTDKLKEIGGDIYSIAKDVYQAVTPEPVQDETEEALEIIKSGTKMLFDVGKWGYDGMIDVLNGCWLPFAQNCDKWLGVHYNIVTPILGLTSPETIKDVNDRLYGQYGDAANDVMAPSGNNPLEDGVGLFVQYVDDMNKKDALASLKEHGLTTAPNNFNMIVPMGLYLDRTPYDIPNVDTNKYHQPSNITYDRFNTMNEVFETIYSPIFYEPEWSESQQLPGGRALVRGDVQNPELRWSNVRKEAPFRDANMVLPRENNRQLAEDLAKVMALQESDFDYNIGWNDDHYYLGAYQFSPENWIAWRDRWLADGTSIGGKGQTVSSTPSPDHQDAIARYKFEKMLDKMDGDIGAVAVEHVSGEPAVYRYYLKGLDFIWDNRTEAQKDPNSPKARPPAEEGNHPTAFEYAGYINRSLWHYMKTNELVKGHDLNPFYGDGYERHDPKGEGKDRVPDQSHMGMQPNPVPLEERRTNVRG